jgi:hypothetical protein
MSCPSLGQTSKCDIACSQMRLKVRNECGAESVFPQPTEHLTNVVSPVMDLITVYSGQVMIVAWAVDFSACKLPSIRPNAQGVMGRKHPTVPMAGCPERAVSWRFRDG